MSRKPAQAEDMTPEQRMDRVTVQKLKVFKTVAEFGHFTKAADFLDLTQPVISIHIRKLEEAVGAELFRRSGRGVDLTEAGKRVLKWANEVLVETSSLEKDLAHIQSGRYGRTSVSSSPSVGSYALARLVRSFMRDNPRARIDLEITHPSAAIAAVRTGRSNFAISLLDASQMSEDLKVEILWYERYIFVCAPDSEWAQRRCSIADLATIPTITGNPGPVRQSIEDDKLAKHGITKRNIIMELGHPEPVKQAVKEGLGCAFLFETTVTDELANGALVDVAIPGLALENPIFLAVRRRKILTPMEIRLIDHIRNSSLAGTSGEALPRISRDT